MKPAARYRVLLDRCLDARRDPLDDTELKALLDAHPELLDDFACECADLRALSAAPTAGPRPRLRRHLRAACAAIAGIAAGIVLCLGPLAPEPPDEPTGRPSRILLGTLVELPTSAHASVHFTLYEPHLQTATTLLETYEQRSQLR